MTPLLLDQPAAIEAPSGRYQIQRCLGEGGYAQVFEAWDPLLCRSVALKRCKPGSSLSPQPLLLEGRMGASLRHPAFVQIFAIEGSGAEQSIIMELVPGHTLSQVIGDGGLAAHEARDVLCQVAEAMSAAHGHGLVHGDLKPSNVMREPGGKVRILDFGLARQSDPLATCSVDCGGIIGTIAYLAPECLLGQPPVPASDIFALGVLLFELIGGKHPLRHLQGLAQAAAQMQANPADWTFPPHADGALVALARAMTARDPRQRPPSMAAVYAAALVPGHGVPALIVPVLPVAPRWRRYWRAAALALLLTAGGALVWQVLTPAVAPFSEYAALRIGLERLRTFDREGSLEQAQQQFEAILSRHPTHAAAAAGAALAYALRYASDSQDEVWLRRADAAAQRALELDDQLALGYAAQAWVREMQGQAEVALALEEQALGVDPHNLFALQGKAELLLQLRRFDAAAAAIAVGMAAYPAERLFTDLLGTLHYQQGAYALAEQAFRRSIALDAESATSYANLNATLLRQNRAAEALQVLQQGLQVRPSGVLYNNLGTALFGKGDYVGAARAYEHAISASKGSPNSYLKWANLADALRWIPGRQDEARRALQRAAELLALRLERAPDNVQQASRMGLYLARLQQGDAALAWTGRALQSAADSADVHFRAALAYEILGRRDAALTQLARARGLGYPPNLIDSEPDLVDLRRDPRAFSSIEENHYD